MSYGLNDQKMGKQGKGIPGRQGTTARTWGRKVLGPCEEQREACAAQAVRSAGWGQARSVALERTRTRTSVGKDKDKDKCMGGLKHRQREQQA